MIIFGEKLNSSIPSALKAMKDRNTEELIRLCKLQEECGADYLDINTAILEEDELPVMLELIRLAQENTGCGIMLDSPSVEVIREALGHISGRKIILNSITVDERHELIALAKEYNAGIVALPITEDGIPDTPEERFQNAEKLIATLTGAGIPEEDIYIDVIIEALAVNGEAAKTAAATASLIRNAHENVHLTCGLSNISFGLPKRANINTAIIPVLMCSGIDSAIIDITGEKTRNAVISARALCGMDEYCIDYIEAFR